MRNSKFIQDIQLPKKLIAPVWMRCLGVLGGCIPAAVILGGGIKWMLAHNVSFFQIMLITVGPMILLTAPAYLYQYKRMPKGSVSFEIKRSLVMLAIILPLLTLWMIVTLIAFLMIGEENLNVLHWIASAICALVIISVPFTRAASAVTADIRSRLAQENSEAQTDHS